MSNTPNANPDNTTPLPVDDENSRTGSEPDQESERLTAPYPSTTTHPWIKNN
jgi:hypothetical protein